MEERPFSPDQTYDLLKHGGPCQAIGLSNEGVEMSAVTPYDSVQHVLSPPIARSHWNALGDYVSRAEKTGTQAVVGGDKWFTLRLDGKTFSGTIRRLVHIGVLEKGFSSVFADIMCMTTQTLGAKFQNVVYAFTQSDEITLIMKPASVIDGVQMPHMFSGRRDKLVTYGAALATQCFWRGIVKHLATKDACTVDAIDRLPDMTFDCRLGTFESLSDAFSLILWRAYDCGVNGVTSAAYHSDIPEVRKTVKQNTLQKVEALAQHGLLPLPHHQAYGAFYALAPTTKTVEFTRDGVLCSTVVTKTGLQQIYGPVLHNFQVGIINLT